MFKKLGNFMKFTKLNKDVRELDDKFIIQHFHHIHIRTLTYTMYSSNSSHNVLLFEPKMISSTYT